DRVRERRRQAVAARGRLAAPAEDDEVGVELRRGFDDALGGVPPDPNDRVDGRALADEVQDALEQPPRMAGPRRALGERHSLGDLDDPERGQLAAARLEEVRAEADELLGRGGIRDGDDDPGRQRPAGDAHAEARAAAAPAGASQRSSRYGFRRSSSRAWRSTWSSARSVVRSRFSTTKLATR